MAFIAAAVLLWSAADEATARLSALTRSHRGVPAASPWRDPGPHLSSLLRRWPAGRWINARWEQAAERFRGARRAAAWRKASIALCQGIVAELATGRPPGEALARTAATLDCPAPGLLRPVIAAARDGGDVPHALAGAAPAQGGEGLLRLAACWHVGPAVGTGLTPLLERVTAALRDSESHRSEVTAQLAAPRATARLLAALPALGLLLGTALGLHPLGFLLGTPAGLTCLALGVTLTITGLMWTHRLTLRALPTDTPTRQWRTE
ncbi:type II secretion system F family protein [Sphaerisporangium sp. B11E5]|uniref:type II secretion system F family protein n=1 Tax=Sphaerisporangium sp. B11E5 TaxID=3153563 RepID=UPI00325EECE9